MDFKLFWERIKIFFGQLSNRQRTVLLAGTAAGVTILVAGIMFLNSVRYGVLYSELDSSEAGAIVTKLKEENISYRLENGGTTIYVPDSQIYDLRLQLAAQGLPQAGGIGYEIFDRTNIGTTDFVQKINYRRALEGELSRTISFMSKIKSSRVHLVIPEERLFEEDRKEPTASITVRLKPGQQLDFEETKSIANLIASSVEGLTSNNVTIVDTNGNILSKPQKSNSVFSLTADQIELQHGIEKYYHDKVEDILVSVLGKDRTAVQVSAELNFDQVDRTVEQYDPDNLVVISQERSSQTAQGGQGADPDRTTNVVTNYQSNRTIERIVQEVGNINRLSVAVMVDGKPGANTPAGTAPTTVPLSTTEINQLTEIVKKTVGYSEDRQDEIAVINMPFDRTVEATELQALDSMETRIFWQTWIMRVVYGVIMIGVGFILFRLSKSFKTIFSSGGMPTLSLDSAGEPINFELSSDIKNSARLQQTISQLTREKPAEAARLLKAWLVEDSYDG